MLDNNQLTDLSVLVEMAEADSNSKQRFASFWRLFLAGNPLADQATGQIAHLEQLGARVSRTPTP